MTANRAMALRVVWGTRVDDDTPASDARELLEMCGLIDADGHEILPDITGGTMVSPSEGNAPGKVDPSSSPLALAESGRRPENCTTPPGLRDLPAPVKVSRKPQPAAKKTSLTSPPARRAPAKRRGEPPASGAVTTTRPPRQRKPIQHGTLSGYTEHSKRKEPIPPDDPCGCRAARAVYDRARAEKKTGPAPVAPPTPAAVAARRPAPILPPIEHGTAAGWQAHHDRGALPACDACEVAVAPPPAPVPIKPQDWLAAAQRSPHRAVARAAAKAIGLRVRIEAASAAQLADGRLLAQLEAALSDISRAQTRATPRANGATR